MLSDQSLSNLLATIPIQPKTNTIGESRPDVGAQPDQSLKIHGSSIYGLSIEVRHLA
jgi:hypothetical protein